MGTPTQTYVDPSIAGDSGAGTVGDPYGDFLWALNTITPDSTNGDQINIKAGTDEIVASAIDLASSYAVATAAAPLIIRGYTSAANDGGIGGMSGGGSVGIFSSATMEYCYMKDMHFHNCGSAAVISLTDRRCMLDNCEVDNTSGAGIVVDASVVINCYVHNCGGIGIQNDVGTIIYNFLENGTNDFSTAIADGAAGGSPTFVGFNVIKIDGSSDGITLTRRFALVMNNSVYSNAGTGTGISTNTYLTTSIMNNIVEGFSGAGGVGIESALDLILYQNNAAYNNTTNYNITGDAHISANNEILGSSPFTDPSSNDFTVSTDVKATAYPSQFTQEATNTQYLDKGALQREEAGAGGTSGRQSLHSIESGGV